MSRSRRSYYENSPAANPSHPVHLWLLRILVPLDAQRSLIERHGFANDTLATILGFGKWVEADTDDFDPQQIRAELRRMHARAEKNASRSKLPEQLTRNIERIAGMVKLDEPDKKILAFAAVIHSDRLLDDTADWLGMLSSARLNEILAVVLDIPVEDIRAALSPTGALARTGLLTVDRRGTDLLKSKLCLLVDSFSDLLLCGDDDFLNSLFRDVVRRPPASVLSLDDFSHIGRSLNLLRPYLESCLRTGRRGANIFIHGLPGTGKTQFARALTAALGTELIEVSAEDSDGDPLNGEKRLRAYRFAQAFYASKRCMILFDEVEDIFDDGDTLFGGKSIAQMRKAWINRALEENPVPTLWLSNAVDCLDPAFVRRFDMVVEMPVPPQAQRRRILDASCGPLLGADALNRIAACDYLAPAIVTRAAAVVQSIADTLHAEQLPGAIEYLVSNTLTAQGYPPLAHDPHALPGAYDPALINTDADLVKVAEGIARSRSARLCLYGPPGTGKSAYARWLAERLDRPLHVRRASDLLDAYVGNTEKRIARAFRAAEQEGALLLLDEVDSFLQDRRGAQRSWEVTAVNEMLTQMESFSGVLVASTNLVDGLDQASLRRFDLKLKFDYLGAAQAWTLFERQCAALGFAAPGASLRPSLGRLNLLTPGDFAAVARQQRFNPAPDPAALMTALEAEFLAKEGAAKRTIGFV